MRRSRRDAWPGRVLPRREFLQLAGASAASAWLLGCDQGGPDGPSPVVPPPDPRPRVAIGRVSSYQRNDVDAGVRGLLDRLGGIESVVKPGDSVAIKVNLTGGVQSGSLPGIAPVESFVTHPEVVRALIMALQDAGAAEVFIVEAVYEWESFRDWGHEDVAAATGAVLVDLNGCAPYSDFREVALEAGALVYSAFTFNPLLMDVDVLVSVSKLKMHYLAGVTHSMKNLYGLVPYRFYRLRETDRNRSGFHGVAEETRARLPRVIVDLNRARPVHFSLIDGVKTVQGGEGPWVPTLAPIEPGVIVAGRNCVATDAVATAITGHSPTADYPNPPFLRGDNHLNIAAALGLGTNRLDGIEVVGVPIAEVAMPFLPAG